MMVIELVLGWWMLPSAVTFITLLAGLIDHYKTKHKTYYSGSSTFMVDLVFNAAIAAGLVIINLVVWLLWALFLR